jgi:thioredoxin 1
MYRRLPDGTWGYTVAKRSEFVKYFPVPEILSVLAAREPGWGGGSTIGGAPRHPDGSRSRLTPDEVFAVVEGVVTAYRRMHPRVENPVVDTGHPGRMFAPASRGHATPHVPTAHAGRPRHGRERQVIMASDLVTTVTDASFEAEVMRSEKPVLLDFTATWCGPCKALAPIVADVAREYEGRLKVAKLDIDDSPNTATRFGIRGVPTVIVFKGGREVARQVGLVPKPRLVALFQDHL